MPTTAALLAPYAVHKRSCNSQLNRYPCTAVNGRRGRCSNRATRTYTVVRGVGVDSRTATYHRCDDHPMYTCDSYSLIPQQQPCSCGLAELIRRAYQENGQV